ncbi:Vitamin D3 hydroxylase-associated protein [Pitangus sulphuratus]|nr:Vitamin D3 hydroxylase-associated protein [Pitangus sulphuratus]
MVTLDAATLEAMLPCCLEQGQHLFSSAAAVVLLKWLGRRQVLQKINEARRSRDLALERMEKAACRFKKENPGTQTTHILLLTMVELAEKLKEGSLSPESILYSYMDKALEVNREVNCVTDFIHGCEDQLQKLKKQKEKGLLYGIPISIKDHINCKMLCALCLRFAETEVLHSPADLLLPSYDCSNLIFGQTLNPLNHQKSPGGSSSGKGALIAGGGSILGIGSDVAGSIHLPSSFCGLCGLKPTGNRISKQGVISPLIGMQSVTAMLGPMARDVDSLALCMRALLCEEMFRLDPTVPPIPFDQEVYHTEFIAKGRKLRLDVVLCPALGPGFNHGYAGKLFPVTSYTNLYNVLNFPARVVPVSTVTRANEEELKHYQGHYRDPWDKRLKEAVEGAVGLPVAVQCVALPWQQELCFRFMKEVAQRGVCDFWEPAFPVTAFHSLPFAPDTFYLMQSRQQT